MTAIEHSILRFIYRSTQTNRRGIADEMVLGLPRVGAFVAGLLDKGLIVEEASPVGSPGRPVGALRINPDAARVVGLDIDPQVSRAVVVDLAGQVVGSLCTPTRVVTDRKAIIDGLVSLVEGVWDQAGLRAAPIAGTGVGLRGMVDQRNGRVLGWPSVSTWSATWTGYDIGADLRGRLRCDLVVVEDSVRAMALNAHRCGPARGQGDFLYVFLGSGIGSALFIGEHVYVGSAGLSGELGHVMVQEDGPWCSCGNRGCLEVLASNEAMLAQVRARLKAANLISQLRAPLDRGDLTLESLLAASQGGDKVAFQVLDEAGNQIGKVIAMAINFLGSVLVILGGPLVTDDGPIIDAVRRQVRLRALPQISGQVSIIADSRDEFAGARGIAHMALDALMDSPSQTARLPVTVASTR